MINFDTILAQNPELMSEKAPEAVSNIKEWFGHYRPDHFDQSVLEDMRQRLSRRGVSLYSFQQDYLPVLYEIMQISVEMGKCKTLPPLFSYEVEPAIFSEQGPLWMEAFQSQASPQTVKRYRLVLERDLLPHFGTWDLCALDGAAVEQYEQEYLAQARSKSCFQYQSRILYLTLDFYIAGKIQEDAELTEALRETDNSYLYLKDVAGQWRRQSDSPISEKDLQSLSHYILPLLGLSNLKTYNPRRLERYRRELARRGLGETVFQQHLEILNQIKEFAEQQGLLDEKPLLENPERGRFSNPHGVTDLARKKIQLISEEDPGGMILRLALEMGLRNEEIRMLKWPAIHFEDRYAEVDGRRVPIPEDLCHTLIRLAVQQGQSGYVILTATTKQGPVSMPYIYRSASKVLKRYGLLDLRLYDLRSSYIIDLLQYKTPEETARQCGYTNPAELLMRYGAYLPEK